MRLSVVAALVAAFTNAVPCEGVSPLGKVVTMLTELHAKVTQEGSQEAATYDKFACFCKSTMTAKTTEISEGDTNKGTLVAQLNQATTRRDQEDTDILLKEEAIRTLEAEIATLKQDRHTERLEYAKSEMDLTKALQGLELAIQTLKAAKDATGLVEVRKMSRTLQQALSMAEALGTGPALRARAALTQLGKVPQVPDSVYDFHADDIVSTLEGLRTDFTAKKTEIDTQESTAKSTFDTLVQGKEAEVGGLETALDNHRKNKAAEAQSVALTSRDLTVAAADLLADQAYLRDLSAKCHEKAIAWDKRSQTRQNELEALARTIELLQSPLVTPTASLLQLARGSKHRAAGARTAQAALVSVHRAPLVQLKERSDDSKHLHSRLRGSHGAVPDPDWRAQAATLLRTKAADLKSTLLLRLAGEVTEDPFGKVKTLIQELIEKLISQAESEANHKGWCDKQIALAEQARDHSADSIREVNSRLEVGEARRAKLGLQIQGVEQELADLNETLLNSTSTREQEKVQNNATVEDAKKGLGVLNEAMDILDKFYKEAANNATSFLEFRSKAHGTLETRTSGSATNTSGGSVEDDAPDAGFGDEYVGATDAKEGIMAMLDVVKSDFERTISETQAAEAKAAQEYYELQRSAEASKAEKTEAKLAWDASLSDADDEDQQDRGSLVQLQTALDNALGELEALYKPCMGTGMSDEEKKMQREQEMQALQTVLCILEKHGIGGIEEC